MKYIKIYENELIILSSLTKDRIIQVLRFLYDGDKSKLSPDDKMNDLITMIEKRKKKSEILRNNIKQRWYKCNTDVIQKNYKCNTKPPQQSDIQMELFSTENECEKPIQKNTKFVKPTLEEVKAYILEKGYNVDPDRWINYYESNGWKVGKNSMKNWKAAVATWNKLDYDVQVGRKAEDRRRGTFSSANGAEDYKGGF